MFQPPLCRFWTVCGAAPGPRIVSRIAERHGFGRIHVKRGGKWVGDYLARYLSKEVRAACPKGKRLWATFGKPTKWCRVKDVMVKSWLGEEYRRLRGDRVGLSRGQSYGVLQQAMMNHALWVERATGIEVWKPRAVSLETGFGNPC